MPWYEPAVRATSQRRHNNTTNDNDDHTNVQNYLDEQWNFPRHSSTNNNNNYENNYDGLQFEVENQLQSSGVLPSSLSMNNNNYSALQFGGMNRRGEVEQSFANNLDQQNNNEMNRNSNMPISKTAAFFHPRPVMALMPYKQFFSPIACPADDNCSDLLEDERKQSATDDNANVSAPLLHNSQAAHSQEYDFQQQQTQQHLTPADDNLANINHTTQEDQQGSTNSSSPAPPSSNLKPKDLFSSFIAKPISTNNNNTTNVFKVPPKQSKLVKDSNTGQMKSSLTNDKEKNKSKKSSWDDYGGRPTVDNADNKKENAPNKDAAAKKKKKKKSSKQQQQSDGTDITDYLNGNKKRVSNDNSQKDGKTKKKKKQRKSNNATNTGTELDIPAYNSDDILLTTNPKESIPKLTQDDFAGIEEMELQNVAQCMEGMRLFLEKFGNQQFVAFSLLFLDEYTGNYTTSSAPNNDNNGKQKKSKKKGGGTRSNKFTLPNSNNSRGYEVTTPFVPSSKKYCTPKGQSCTAWNCTCDDQIRSLRASASLLGAMFVFKNTVDIEGVANIENQVGEWECFLLPLGPTNNEQGEPPNEIDYQRMSNWPIIPFLCGVSLSDRWAAFEAILLNQRTKLVTYNATVSLLPYYQHLASDVGGSSNSTSSVSVFAACIAGGDNNNSDMSTPTSSSVNNMRNDGYIQSIWDLRLVSWMLRDNATDNELEFSKFQEGFAHLAPQDELHSNMSAVMQGCISAKNSLQLVYKLYPIVNGQLVRGGLLDSLEVIEQPVQSILAQMECRGVGFFPHRLKRIEVQLECRLEELSTTAIQITKDPDFLLSSPQQVSSFLFDTLKLSMPAGLVAKNKTVHRSTSEEALKAIRSEMKSRTGSSPQIIDIILESRQLNKLLTTYIRPLPKVCRRNNNSNQANNRGTSPKRSKKQPARIYPQWMQTATRTGRLSCRKPNLQQIPKKGAFGVDPREAFAADQGLCLFACDYSQKEVRILAHMSGDEALVSLFRGDPNIDIYKQMSSIIRNKPLDTITDQERAQFKQVTLAILYGMSPNQVAKKLSISKTNAQQMMNDFFRRFRRVKSWMDETKSNARKNSYVTTIAGRKRYLDDINSDDNSKRSQAERQAINTVIQGSAADLMKAAMINMTTNLTRWQDVSSRPRMLLQIHDEMILEVCFNENDIKDLKDIAMKSCCSDCERLFQLKVPLLLNCSAGMSWGAMRDL